MWSNEMPGGLPHAMFGEQPSSRTPPLPTHTLPPTFTVAGTTGVPDVGSPGVTASSSAPGLTMRLCSIHTLPEGV